MFNKIAIVGVGLIGGSIGLAVKKKRLAKEVIGACRRESSGRKALKFKSVDKATLNLKGAVASADIVIIASPVGKIAGLAEEAIKFMKKGAILTDVGSAKEEIVRKIEKLAKGKVNFIGAHPMAGSDKSGVENADPVIFNNALVLLTKTKNTNRKAISSLGRFWKNLGCRVFILPPRTHDEYASLASYLPHAVSFALSLSQTKNSVKIAGGSLKDTTRVASSDTELWTNIFLSARQETLKAIKIFSDNLKALDGALRKRDRRALKRLLNKAKKIRSNINDNSNRRAGGKR